MTEEETAIITRLAKSLSAAQSKVDYRLSMNASPKNAVALELARTELAIAQQALDAARHDILQRRARAS